MPMSKELERPISNFAAPAVNYPLVIAGTIVFLCLAAGVVLSIWRAKLGIWPVCCCAAVIGAAVLVFLNLPAIAKKCGRERGMSSCGGRRRCPMSSGRT